MYQRERKMKGLYHKQGRGGTIYTHSAPVGHGPESASQKRKAVNCAQRQLPVVTGRPRSRAAATEAPLAQHMCSRVIPLRLVRPTSVKGMLHQYSTRHLMPLRCASLRP